MQFSRVTAIVKCLLNNQMTHLNVCMIASSNITQTFIFLSRTRVKASFFSYRGLLDVYYFMDVPGILSVLMFGWCHFQRGWEQQDHLSRRSVGRALI